MGIRVPSAVFIGVGTLFFLLYLLPWQHLPNVPLPYPSPTSLLSRSSNNRSSFVLTPPLQTVTMRDWTFVSSAADQPSLVTYLAIRQSNLVFNSSGSDVLVILHIQKTGGTAFEKHIVQDLIMDKPCVCWKRRKRCKCPRPSKNVSSEKGKSENSEPWLFSRFSTGWICGLHADWTELTACVDAELDRAHGSYGSRRYFYVSMIRDPIHRFLSEFRHVQRGATWKASRHICNGQYASPAELGKCYSGRSWTGVSLNEFLSCSHNLAFNRQTRMLSDLKLIGCYNKSVLPDFERNAIMLASAKRNLENMAFFGLTEYQRISQYIFEETFKMRFKIPFSQNEDTYSKATLDKSSADELQAVRRINSLDLELYAFAEQLLHIRFKELKEKDSDFDEHYNFLGEEKGFHFSWDEIENED